ncbi:MAG: addiction module toxin RelE [Halioglobus sp.]|nr:addiction module toxin RelE [Halioglobus sp.]|tara:strand:- start:2765 stop:3619 length:855 start_codon:yes stop_codon:yes gene_type:complete
MSRPLRIEFPGAFYHVTSRGNARQTVFREQRDYRKFLGLFGDCCARYQWLCHAYCLMGNHYHLLIETGEPTLSKGMKFLNGCYTQAFNRYHEHVGHVFQGRFHAVLVDSNAYLLELARYIALNPVRAQMVESVLDWPWSSYRETAGYTHAGSLLTSERILAHFSSDRETAHARFRQFVANGAGSPSPWRALKHQIYLGSGQFVQDMQSRIEPGCSLDEVPSAQTRPPPRSLEYYARRYPDKREAMALAYLSGHYTLKEVGSHFAVSYATVSRAVKAHEGVNCKT